MLRARARHASAGVFGILAALAGCHEVGSNRSDPVLLPAAFEVALGASVAENVGKQYKVSIDAALAAYVSQVGGKMAAVCDRKDVPYTFTVLDDKIVNAFAVPGGHVYVTTGILRRLSNEAELAAVLGHEVGHVVHHHGVKQLQRELGVEAVAAAISTFLLNPDDRGKKEAVEFVTKASGVLLLRANSRDDELQSDESGVLYCHRAWYDPASMVGVQRMLKSIRTSDPTIVDALLSTHPLPDDRIAHAEAEAKKLPAPPRPYNKNAESYRTNVLARLH